MTIIIPTCKRSNLEPCLKSIRQYSTAPVLVVANGFDDRKWLESTAVDFIWADQRLGYTNAILRGIKATNDDVVLLNDDVVILPQERDRWLNDLSQWDYSGAKMLRCDVTGKDFLLFFCVFIRRSVLDKVGLPDEIFNPGFGEDIDYAWRVEGAGYKQRLVPLNIFHKGGDTVHSVDSWEDIVIRNKKILFDRYVAPKSSGKFDKVKESMKAQDIEVYNEIFVSKSYDVLEEEARDNVVFDFGANRGMFAVHMLDIGAKEVLAVEANPQNYKEMVDNVKDFPEIKSVLSALHETDGLVVRISNKGTASTTSLDGEYETPTVTLTTLTSQYPNQKDMVLKLDCEGAEYDVLFSTEKDVFRRFKYVSCEVHTEFNLNPKYRGIEMFNTRMQDFGYEKVKDNQIFSWDVTPTGERVNWKGLPLWIQKWVRIDSSDEDRRAPLLEPIKNKDLTVTAVVNTFGRYNSTLPMTLLSIINQTKVPENIVIFDDNEPWTDLRTIPTYAYLFQMMHDRGIEWYVQFGTRRGQHWNHQSSQNFLKQDLIWRLDDDEVANPDVLQILLSNFGEDIGAVGGLVLTPGAKYWEECGSNHILNVKDNCQWYRWEGKREVQHLYSSFLYRSGIVSYELSLSKAAHREETIFSHRLWLKGYRLIVDSAAVTTHLRNPEGGIRTIKPEFFKNDDKIFEEVKREWRGELVVYLNNGLGDHVVFKTLLPELHKKYKKVTIACCYPNLFEGERCIGLEEGKTLVTPDRFDVYKWMADREWKDGLLEAFRGMYLND